MSEELETLYQKFNDRRYRTTDPIQFAHRYSKIEDIEIVALVSALFAYGNVKSMCKTLEVLIQFLGPTPALKLKSLDAKNLKAELPLIYYRFFSTEDVHQLLIRIASIIQERGSLRSCMMDIWSKNQGDILESLFLFRKLFLNEERSSPGMKFMFPHPKEGAAKRLHMFLRWMVRSDEVDLGVWDFIPTSALIVPLDTHVFKAARRLRLTRRKTPSLKAALEVTQGLRRICPQDPLKYDFALCHSGMRIAELRG